MALNDSSDGETNNESLWGQQGSAGLTVQQNQGTLDCPEREGLDRELQTFITMRDQTDQATEVGGGLGEGGGEDGLNFMMG